MTKRLNADQLEVRVYGNRTDMGADAALMLYNRIKDLLARQSMVNIIFAAAPSQNEFLKSLRDKDIDWSRINAFHMDEYVGLKKDAPQGFGNFLKDILFNHVALNSFHLLNGNAGNLFDECIRYTQLLKAFPTDIVCMGIGENGHLAFNDPPVADFNDKQTVKLVELDSFCRQQQVNDGCFGTPDDVPAQALTLTIPILMKSKYVYCVVPGKTKAKAVYNTVYNEIIERYPSTILRNHPNAILYLDNLSAAQI